MEISCLNGSNKVHLYKSFPFILSVFKFVTTNDGKTVYLLESLLFLYIKLHYKYFGNYYY